MLTKIEEFKLQFSNLNSKEAFYQKIIELGKKLPPFDPAWRVEGNLVSGCQSLMYLHTKRIDSNLYFYAESNALISAGLAYLLIEVYSGEPPDTLLLSPPKFLEDIGIPTALSPGRANGLASLYFKMKQEAVRQLLID